MAGIVLATVLGCVLAVAILLVFRRYFVPYRPTAFFGDDLSLVISYDYLARTKSITELFTGNFASKYRPIFELSYTALAKLTGQRLDAIFFVLGLLHVVCTAVVFVIAGLLSRSIASAVLLAFCVLQSNFALFHLTQVFGPLEAIPAFFILLTVLFVAWPLRDARRSRIGFALAASLCCWFACFTHERYLLVNLVLAILFASGAYVQGAGRWFLALLPLLTIASNFAAKRLLGLPILLGTANKPIDVDPWRLVDHVAQAVLSIFGANYGPEYLTGMNFVARRDWMALSGAALFAFLFVVVLVAAAVIVRRKGTGWRGFAVPLLLIGVLGAILLPAISTIRLEQRWLHMPLALVLLLFAWGLGELAAVGRGRIGSIIAVVVAVIFIGAHERLLTSNTNIYFVYAGRIASDLHADIVRTGGSDRAPVVLVAAREHCNWTLLQGKFFEFYQGMTREHVCVPNIEQAERLPNLLESRVFLHRPDRTGITDVTAAVWMNRVPKGHMLLDQFAAGKLSDSRPAGTPSGRGAFLADWRDALASRRTVTILPGFAYAFEVTVPPSGPVLVFGGDLVYPKTGAARLRVTIRDASAPERSCSHDTILPPREPGRPFEFDRIALALDGMASRSVVVEFRADALTRDARSIWVAVAEPALVRTDELPVNLPIQSCRPPRGADGEVRR